MKRGSTKYHRFFRTPVERDYVFELIRASYRFRLWCWYLFFIFYFYLCSLFLTSSAIFGPRMSNSFHDKACIAGGFTEGSPVSHPRLCRFCTFFSIVHHYAVLPCTTLHRLTQSCTKVFEMHTQCDNMYNRVHKSV